MAWDWVGPVSTAAVGIAGLCSTVWVARQGRRHAERLSEESKRTTLALATEARSQQRLESAYRRLLEIATETTSFVTFADVIWKRDAEPPDIDEVADEVMILLAVYASKPMREYYDAWMSGIEKLRKILDQVPDGKKWYDCDNLADQFCQYSDDTDRSLHKVYEIARYELA
jgi:hypothetical protein